MIHYRKFELNRDLTRLEQYLRDFVYRISASNSFGSRKDFYAAAGFRVEDSIGYWYKTFENSLTSFEQN